MAAGTRDRILDALETLLLADGTPGITLEAVAAEAGISKGGLLYHFPGKEPLLVGAVERLGERVEEQLESAQAAGTSIAEWYLTPASEDPDSDVHVARSIIAALRSADGQYERVQTELNRIMRAYDERLVAELGDPVLAEIVRLAGDGIYLGQIVGLDAPDPDLNRRVIERLLGSPTRD